MTRTTFKKVPFDIELAKKITNKEVKGRIVTEDNLTARIVCFDYNFGGKKDNIVAIIEHTGYEGVLTCFADGLYHYDFFNKKIRPTHRSPHLLPRLLKLCAVQVAAMSCKRC